MVVMRARCLRPVSGRQDRCARRDCRKAPEPTAEALGTALPEPKSPPCAASWPSGALAAATREFAGEGRRWYYPHSHVGGSEIIRAWERVVPVPAEERDV